MTRSSSWKITGAEGEPIIGDCHRPNVDPQGVVLIAHGFKGYKDYGMFPRIAETMAKAGFIAHRFNFSHSGMTENIDTFERPDLFEKDTWNKQVHDFRAVIDGVASGSIEGRGRPFVMFGHSRGGVSALLTAGRYAGDAEMAQPAGVVTAAAPSSCLNLSPEQEQQLMDEAFILSPSSRTGQDLRVGKSFVTEQRADPEGHDVLELVRKIACPLLVIHGDQDPTVPHTCAKQIAAVAQDAEALIIEGADHVFNTANPLADDEPTSPQLQQMLDRMIAFAEQRCA